MPSLSRLSCVLLVALGLAVGVYAFFPCPGVIVQCIVPPCLTAVCPNFPGAKCVDDYCNGCRARWFYRGVEVTFLCRRPW